MITEPNLASERLGATVVAANDDFFGEKENLIKDAAPVWDPNRYTDRGKWMDGWESRRRREPGHDWCVVRLAGEGVLSRLSVDTAHFTGNYPESCSVEGCYAPDAASSDDLEDVAWQSLVPQAPLEGNTEHLYSIDCPYRLTHMRLNIHPDGGVARLRAYGRILPDLDELAQGPAVLSALRYGGRILDASDRHFAEPENLLLLDPPTGMRDGWETRRRRGPGNDWVVIRLAAPARPRELMISTRFFVGNAPTSCSAEVLTDDDYAPDLPASSWTTLLDEQPLEPDTEHTFSDLAEIADPAQYVRVQIYPDGGLARVGVVGDLAPCEALDRARLDRLNTAPPERARDLLRACSGAAAWVERLEQARPFASVEALLEAGDEAFEALGEDDWLEAFRAHPAIGERKSEVDRGKRAAAWSEVEQSTAAESVEASDELAAANAAYRDKFGFIFIICAEGRPADEILESLRERLEHGRDEEIEIAAVEERKIAASRLRRLINP